MENNRQLFKLYLSVHDIINLLNHFVLILGVQCEVVRQQGQRVRGRLKTTQEKQYALRDDFRVCQTWFNSYRQPLNSDHCY